MWVGAQVAGVPFIICALVDPHEALLVLFRCTSSTLPVPCYNFPAASFLGHIPASYRCCTPVHFPVPRPHVRDIAGRPSTSSSLTSTQRHHRQRWQQGRQERHQYQCQPERLLKEYRWSATTSECWRVLVLVLKRSIHLTSWGWSLKKKRLWSIWLTMISKKLLRNLSRMLW